MLPGSSPTGHEGNMKPAEEHKKETMRDDGMSGDDCPRMTEGQ